ncbi:MAG: hypothetical protein CSA72_03565 [Rhodobacterales bacterium]|nr:MAG: hypothetical protein CSA72_03565 [Rhodobacterales bacterium]
MSSFEHKLDGYAVTLLNPGATRTMLILMGSSGADRAPDPSFTKLCLLAERRGISAAVVTCDETGWYQGVRAGRLFAQLRAIACSHERVIAIGSGMGAYGAMALAQEDGVDEVIAFSPVAELDPRKGPQDWRFDEEFDRLGAFAQIQRHRAGRYTVFYDPGSAERRHLAALGLPEGRTERMPMPGTCERSFEMMLASPIWIRFLKLRLQGRAMPRLAGKLRVMRRESMPYLRALVRRNAQVRPGVAAWADRQLAERGYRPRIAGRIQHSARA